MSILNIAFNQLLKNIEPSQKAKEFAQDAHEPIRDHLSSDKEFSQYFDSSFLYGSYKRQTAIEDIKDVDIIVLTKFNQESFSPQRALSILKKAIGRYYNIPNNEEFQTRSIKVNQPLPHEDIEMTLDIVPAISTGDVEKSLLVPDRDLGEWKLSNPKGHLNEISRLNSENESDGLFIPLVKLIRFWWKHQSKNRQPSKDKHRPKGFWLECLTMENFDKNKKTLAEQFVVVLESVTKKYSKNSGIPELRDPGLPTQTVSTGMSQEEFNFFFDVVLDTLPLAKQAIQEPDDSKSSGLWKNIFGDKFPSIGLIPTSTRSSTSELINESTIPNTGFIPYSPHCDYDNGKR